MKTVMRAMMPMFAAGVVLVSGTARATVWIPRTVEQHERAAKEYDAKAREWREVAASHKEMAEAYSKPDAGLEAGLARVHCVAIAQDAARMAAHAEEMAKYHWGKAAKLKKK